MTLHYALAPLLGEAANKWVAIKLPLEDALNGDVLHVVAGVVVQLAVALVLRRRLASWVPWLVALGLELLNEGSDLLVERWPDHGDQLVEGAWDLAMTMALPTMVLVAARVIDRLRVSR